jgi:dipeptidyl aminopeptidase/acylaminoacyl peptidase
VIFAATASAATRYDPRLRFRTVSTARFDIHFHQGEEGLARRLAGIVEAAAAEVDAAVGPAVGRVQVILVNQHDLSNGWATPLPYNTIEISVAAPSAEESLGNVDDWLRLVFVHEYTHIAHLSRAGGWIGGLRRGFGRLPLLFPNLYQPIWGIEGIATWRESASTGRGRVPAGDFRLLIERAAGEGRFDPIDRAGGGNVDWPSGTTPYLYGAYFHEFLANRYGEGSIRTLAGETARRVPYLGSRAYKKVYGRSLGDLWKDFEAATIAGARGEALPRDSVRTRLTHHGFMVSGPRSTPDGRIFYSAISPHHFPALMEIRLREDVPVGGPRRVGRRFLGNQIAIAGEHLLLDEVDLVRSVGLQSDLYLVDPRTGDRQRLTREARAQDPDVSPEGIVVCAIQMDDRRALATFALPGGDRLASPVLLISDPETDFASPRWSPDGRWIAAERRQVGGSSDIVLIDPSARTVRVVARIPGGRSASPVWMPDGAHVLFSSAVEDAPFRIYRVEVSTGAVAVLEGTGPSAQSPDVSQDGRTLVFVGYTTEGYDLFSLPLGQARWTPLAMAPAAEAARAPEATEEVTDTNVRPYSATRTLAPQFWTPAVESDADEVVIGARTGSADALGRHGYGVSVGWSSRARPDWRAGYQYDRWRPTFFASLADDTDPWRSGEVRTIEANVGLLLPVSRVRASHTALVAFHVADDAFACAACSPPVETRRRRATLRTGWDFTSARGFGYSIGNEEGGRVSVTAEALRNLLDAEGSGVALAIDARGYWRVWPRHGAIAVRGAAGAFWGDREAERVFSAAGHGPQPGGFGFGQDAIGLLRGFDEEEAVGTRAVVLNLDYRAPLWRIDRGVGTVPFFCRVLHGAVFVDTGHAWTGVPRRADLRVSIGAEFSADAVVGFVLPLTFTAGGAWRRDGDRGDRGFVAFARIGRAF